MRPTAGHNDVGLMLSMPIELVMAYAMISTLPPSRLHEEMSTFTCLLPLVHAWDVDRGITPQPR